MVVKTNIIGVSLSIKDGETLTEKKTEEYVANAIEESGKILQRELEKDAGFFTKIGNYFRLKYQRYECYVHWVGSGEVWTVMVDEDRNKVFKNFSIDFFTKTSNFPAKVGYLFIAHKYSRMFLEKYELIATTQGETNLKKLTGKKICV